jgi:MoaA/NifB/PqqE/SkfB family radical SAM enzyme
MNLLENFLGLFKSQDEDSRVGPAVDPGLKTPVNAFRDNGMPRSTCFAPSVSMIFAEDGTIRVCCHNRENLLGTYPDKSIHEIWHGDDARLFRKKMSEQQFLSGCWVCSNHYNSGSTEQNPARHFDAIPQHSSYPTAMEFLLKNTCNLECVMCSGELSSSIRTNREKLPLQKSPYGEEFLDQIQEFIPYLKETRFSSSGEAFLIDLNFRLWEMLIDKNPDCLIAVQTNGTIMNARVRDFLARGNFRIGVSLDSLKKEVFESIRINASFDRVMENIRYFTEYSKAHQKTLIISTCVMRQTWKELPDFVNFCNSIGAVAIFHKVMTPLQFALHNLPADELQGIYDELSVHQFSANTPAEQWNQTQYQDYVSQIAAWIKNAGKRDEGPGDMEALGTDELLMRLKSKFQVYIRQGNMLETDREELVRTCENKIDHVVASLENEQQRKTWLMLLCSIPTPSIYPAVKNLSPDKLLELSRLRV